VIVEDDDLYVNTGLHNSTQFLDGHLDTAVAYDGYHIVRSCAPYFAPMAAGKAKPMVPNPPLVTLLRVCVKVGITAGHHLVLAYVGYNNRIAFG
jgi:hypothetical protein